MNIYISDSGIFNYRNAAVEAPSASVEKIKPLRPLNEGTESVVREAQKAYVAENTPAYTINISSAGRAAVQTLKRFSESINNFSASTDKYSKTDTETFKNSEFSTEDRLSVVSSEEREFETVDDIKEAVNYSEPENPKGVIEEEDDTEVGSAPVNSNNLARYTEFQLQQLVTEGSISRADMNSELDKRTGSEDSINTEAAVSTVAPVMNQAIMAYNYQMSFRANAASM